MLTSLRRAAFLAAAKARIIVAGLCLVALAGCSLVRLGYGQAPDLTYWWLDGYLDLNGEQTPLVRDGLEAWFAWHRATQLPDYADLLARAQADVQRDITPELACRWGDELRQRTDRLLEPAVPTLVALVTRLTPAQVQHLQAQFRKKDDEFRDEFLQDAPEARQKESLRRTLDRLEMLYGRLDDAQRERVAQGLAASPFDPQQWARERQARQQDIVQTLQQARTLRDDPARAEALLRGLVSRAGQSPRPAYRAYQQALTEYNCAFSARIHNATTPAQRQAAVRRLKGWEDDLRALAAAARPLAAQKLPATP
jgi:hypothetical protein